MTSQGVSKTFLQKLFEDLSLSQNGSILVSVPLFFQLLFVGILLFTIFQTERELEHAEAAKKVVDQVRNLDTCMIEVSAGLSRYALTISDDDKQFILDNLVRYKASLISLNNLIASSSDSNLAKICSTHKQLIQVMAQGQELISLGLRKDASPLLLRLRELNGQVQEYESAFIERNNNVAVRTPEMISAGAMQLESSLFTAMLFSLISALFLSFVFSKSISARLLQVYENVERFACGVEPMASLDGKDEISQLDREFRKMTVSVTESRNRERAAMDKASELICSIDENFKFLAWNKALASFLGRENLQEVCFYELFSKGSAKDKIREVLKGIRKDKDEKSFEAEFELESSLQSIMFTSFWSQEESSFFLVGRNITEAKQIEQQRRELVAMVSHDLRSPLTSMMIGLQSLSTGLVADLSESAEATAMVTDSLANCSLLLRLVNNLLQVEKFDSGEINLVLKKIEIQSLLESAIKSKQELLHGRELELLLGLFQFEITADGALIKQVLEFVLEHSIHYCPKDQKIAIAMQRTEDGVELRFEHPGVLPDDYLSNAFDCYRKPGGIGELPGGSVAMSLSKRILEAHGGMIGIESSAEQATIISLRLKGNPDSSRIEAN